MAKDEAVDRAETAENALRDANFRVEKAKEETMALEKKLSQLRNDLTTSQDELLKANEKLDLREKTLAKVKVMHQIPFLSCEQEFSHIPSSKSITKKIEINSPTFFRALLTKRLSRKWQSYHGSCSSWMRRGKSVRTKLKTPKFVWSKYRREWTSLKGQPPAGMLFPELIHNLSLKKGFERCCHTEP